MQSTVLNLPMMLALYALVLAGAAHAASLSHEIASIGGFLSPREGHAMVTFGEGEGKKIALFGKWKCLEVNLTARCLMVDGGCSCPFAWKLILLQADKKISKCISTSPNGKSVS